MDLNPSFRMSRPMLFYFNFQILDPQEILQSSKLQTWIEKDPKVYSSSPIPGFVSRVLIFISFFTFICLGKSPEKQSQWDCRNYYRYGEDRTAHEHKWADMHDQCYQILHKNAEENKAQLALNNPVAVHSGLVTTDTKKTRDFITKYTLQSFKYLASAYIHYHNSIWLAQLCFSATIPQLQHPRLGFALQLCLSNVCILPGTALLQFLPTSQKTC